MLEGLKSVTTLIERIAKRLQVRNILPEHAFMRLATDDALLERVLDVFAQDADSQQPTLDTHRARLQHAIKLGGYGKVHRLLRPEEFTEKIFGEVGEGHTLCAPSHNAKATRTSNEIEIWLNGFREHGLEPATLADLLAYGAEHPDESRIVAMGSISNFGSLVYISKRCGMRRLVVCSRGRSWDSGYKFLLRTIRQPPPNT